MRQAGRLDQIDPLGWALPCTVHRPATPTGHTAFKSRAPSVFKGATANRRMVRLPDRPVTCTSRNPDSARPRTRNLDALEFSRRFLQHVLPEGWMKVRHCGLMHASGPIPPDTLRQRIALPSDASGQPPPSPTGPPPSCYCPDCGGHLLVVPRVFPCQRAFFDTGEANHACAPAHVSHPPSPYVEGQGLLRPEPRIRCDTGVDERRQPLADRSDSR